MEFRACSDEIPPCSFEIARRLLWRNTNNELLPVYDHQLCGCYLQPQILRCECLGDDKWFLISLKSEFITQIWVRHSNLREKFSCAFPSNLSDELRFEWRTQIWVKSNHHSNLSETVWYPPDLSEPSNLSDHPELRESRSDHQELSASPIFQGGHLSGK